MSADTALLQEATAAAVPAVFRGLNSSWPAVQKWRGSSGLRYLKESVGRAEVQVSQPGWVMHFMLMQFRSQPQ
jgi:hypothetical protein